MGQQYNVQTPGQTISFSGTSTYIYFYIYFYSGTNNAYTPTLEDLNVQLFTQAPSNVKIDIGNDGSDEWTYQNTLLGTTTATGGNLLSAINNEIPGTEVDLSQFQSVFPQLHPVWSESIPSQ